MSTGTTIAHARMCSRPRGGNGCVWAPGGVKVKRRSWKRPYLRRMASSSSAGGATVRTTRATLADALEGGGGVVKSRRSPPLSWPRAVARPMTRAVAVGPAIEFVKTHGKPFDRAVLNVLLGEDLGDEGLAALTEPQNPDGGFRVLDLSTSASVVGRTAEMLTYLIAVGAEEYGAAQAAADFLIERQRPDGTWGEDETLRQAS